MMAWRSRCEDGWGRGNWVSERQEYGGRHMNPRQVTFKPQPTLSVNTNKTVSLLFIRRLLKSLCL